MGLQINNPIKYNNSRANVHNFLPPRVKINMLEQGAHNAQVCALATSKIRQARRDARLGLSFWPGPRASPSRAGRLWAALLHTMTISWSCPEGLHKACAPHPLPWAPTGLCSCPAAPAQSLASRECVCVATSTSIQTEIKWGKGSCPHFVCGQGAENVLTMLNTANRKIEHLSYLPPQSFLPSQGPGETKAKETIWQLGFTKKLRISQVVKMFPFIAEMPEYISKYSWSLLALLIITVPLENEYLYILPCKLCKMAKHLYSPEWKAK